MDFARAARLTLPLTKTPELGSNMSENSRSYRIFVVDDESTIASTTATILANAGFDAHAFTSPFEVLKATGGAAPDLLLADVLMPLLSGIELAQRVLAACPECKILLFSGQPDSGEVMIETTQKTGRQFELLPKPIHPRDLLAKVHTSMGMAPSVTSSIKPSRSPAD